MTAPARIVVATSNRGKVDEIRAILGSLRVEWLTLADVGPIAFPDEGGDYRENALTKARVAAAALDRAAVADDSGLEVDALDGAPGVYSARYGGPGLDDRGRVERLLEALTGVPPEQRGARFVCWAALALPGGESVAVRGECGGRILEAPVGAGGFGYDPVFQPEGQPLAMAELGDAVKNRISHRACAFRVLEAEIVARLGGGAIG